MAIVFMDGFDHYQSIDILAKWNSCSWTPSATGTLSSDGNGDLGDAYANGTGRGLGLYGSGGYVKKNLDANLSTIIVGIYFYLNNSTFGAGNFITLFDESTEQCSVRITSAGKLTMNRGTTVIATSTNALSPRSWYHIEAKITPANSGGAYEVKVNGTSTNWLSGTSVDLASTANDYTNAIGIYGCASRACYYDDLYILNTTSPNNDFLGPQKIITIFPAEAGTNTDWTPNLYENFNNVNARVPYPSGYTYNYSLTTGDIDSFKFGHAVSGAIAGIAINLLTRQEIGEQRTLSHYMIVNSTPSSGSPIISPTSNFLVSQKIMDRDPSSNAWTATSIDSSEFGYKLES